MQKISKGNFKIIIPARWKSSRFPGKPLALILDKPLIERVWEACAKAVISEKILVATDSKKIEKFCIKKKMNVMMTSKSCLTGTDRIIEVSKRIKSKIFINVQGDEPLLDSLELQKFIKIAVKKPDLIFIAKCKIDETGYLSQNLPKIVTDSNDNLIYISRSPIPSNKDKKFQEAFGQVNIYSFPRKILKNEIKNKKTYNEKFEDIEILRFLELGYKIKVIKMKKSTQPVDIVSDINKVEKLILKKDKY